MPENIDQFNDYCAKILSHLYDKFPSPTAIQTHILVGGEIDEYELKVCPKTTFGSDTVRWLRNEGFIVAEGGNFGTYHGCYLTAKGLSALNATPESLAPGETVIAKLKKGLATGSSEVTKSAIGAFVTSVMSGVL